jgi:long-subunit acyl-CoA synthetase (AMP-forming)
LASVVNESLAVQLQNKEIRKLLLQYLQKYTGNFKHQLTALERIGNVYFEAEEFSSENNLQTPTLKMKRALIRQKYSTVIERLYTENLNKLE